MITADEARTLFTIENRVASLLQICEDEIKRGAYFKQKCRIVLRKWPRTDQEDIVVAQVIELLRVSGFSVALEEQEVWINDQLATDRTELDLVISWEHE
jgi:hypothetical protein